MSRREAGESVTVAASVGDVVRNGLCIGCGLCEAVSEGAVAMTWTDRGSLRPAPIDGFTREQEARILASCPGVVLSVRSDGDASIDEIWGAHRSMVRAWAGDPDIRFRAATGGVLTALAAHALRSGRVRFVLHVAPNPERPARSQWVLSTSPEEVIERSGSRYGPTAPLAGLGEALNRGEPFGIVAKPCDLSAVHSYSAVDPRVDELCVVRLALVCGGQSRFTKTAALLDEFGVPEDDVAMLRYRGEGNPGPTKVVTHAGQRHEITYLDMWADESGWDVETRCKLCPDALGECGDVAAADAWPGGAPTEEDAGFNAIVVRTVNGQDLVDDAVLAGRLVLGDPLTPRQFDELQPHQVRKKRAMRARYEGLADAGSPVIETAGLRVRQLGSVIGREAYDRERAGAAARVRSGRFTETVSDDRMPG